jgi:hypothetical protein
VHARAGPGRAEQLNLSFAGEVCQLAIENAAAGG